MLFWEAPAGVGFSYCDQGGDGCPATHYNDTTTAAQNAQFLCNFFDAYPEYRTNDFFMTGESYAGVYIPTTALYLLEHQCPDFHVNLQGVAIGNGCTGTDAGTCSPQRSWNTFERIAAHGFISQTTVDEVKFDCGDSAGFTFASAACQSSVLKASAEAGPFYHYQIFDTCDVSDSSTLAAFICSETVPTPSWACDAAGLEAPPADYHRFEGPHAGMYGYVDVRDHGRSDRVARRTSMVATSDEYQPPETYPCGGDDALSAYLSNADVMQALHVTAAKMMSWPGKSIQYTRSAANLLVSPGYPDLVKQTRVLIYSGEFDGQIPTSGTEEWTRGLGYDQGEAWRPWRLADDDIIVTRGDGNSKGNGGTASGAVAGHVVTYDVPTEFSFLTVNQAGHMVPTYRPQEALAMLKRFINGSGY